MAYTFFPRAKQVERVLKAAAISCCTVGGLFSASDVNVLTVTADRERIYSAPVFDYARIDEYSRPDYITNIYSYYGVSPGAEIGAGVSRTTTTGVSAGTTGGASAAGSPRGWWRLTCSTYLACRGSFTSRQRIAESACDLSKTSRYGITT